MPELVTASILVASEDENFTRDLHRPGISVMHTNDGFDAVRLAVKNRPDMIILDSTQSGLPCQTVALWLKLNPATSSIPVIGLIDEVDTWDDTGLDAVINRNKAVDFTLDFIPRLDTTDCEHSLASIPANAKPFDPLAVSLDLIDIYRERLQLATSMIDIAGIQHDHRDFEYVIKALLDAAGRNLDSPLMAIVLLREHSLYVLVRDNTVSVSDLDTLERACLDGLQQETGNRPVIEDQIVFGRRKLSESSDHDSEEPYIFGSVIRSETKPVGYVAGIGSRNESGKIHYNGLLPDLAAQIAQLLSGAENIREQEDQVGELTSVLRAAVETSKISPYASTNGKNFLLQFLLIILDFCNAEKGSIILLDDDAEQVKEIALLGCTEEEILALPYQNGATLQESLFSRSVRDITLDPEENDGSRSRLIVPLTLGKRILGCMVALGLPSAPGPRMDQALKTLSGLGGYLVFNRCVYQRAVDSAIFEDQLKLAREIQEDMIPETHPDLPGYDIFGASVAARQVGGDFFDYLPLDDGRLGIAIGDVAGKAIPASLLMTMTRALVLAACERSTGPEQVLKDVNSHLSNRVTNGRFVTASLLTIKDDQLTYASAGHQPLMIYRAETGEFEDISADGIAMGIIDQMDFEQVNLSLHEGDIALMYTDGLNETMNSNREDFGFENIRKVVHENASGSAREIVESLFRAAEEHLDDADNSDDTTILAIKRIADKDHDHGN